MGTKTVRVWLHSESGMWTFYDGHVDVVVDSQAGDMEAFGKAKERLHRTSFPDRPVNSWVFEKAEVLK